MSLLSVRARRAASVSVACTSGRIRALGSLVGLAVTLMSPACASSRGETAAATGGGEDGGADGGGADASAMSDAGSSRRDTLILTGGRDNQGTTLGDTWSFDGAAWRQVPVDPLPRFGHGMATVGRKVVSFGDAMTYTFDGVAWSKVDDPGPGLQRREFAMAGAGGQALLVGGSGVVGGSAAFLDDAWTFDGARWVEGPRGPIRAHHALAALGSSFVLYGGGPVGAYATETVTFTAGKWSSGTLVAGPGPRDKPAMAALGATVVLFGGATKDGTLGDTWTYDGSNWTRRDISGPSPRWYHAMATLGSVVVLFGGVTSVTSAPYMDDTWTFDGAAWTKLSIPGPPARASHAMAPMPSQ
jgi:hypothetical protein